MYVERFNVDVVIPEGERDPEELKRLIRSALRVLEGSLRASGREGAWVEAPAVGKPRREPDE